METIKLRNTENLLHLANKAGLDVSQFETKLLELMIKMELLEDSEMDCGSFLWELFEEKDEIDEVLEYFDLFYDEILHRDYLNNLQVINKLDDCPKCGCEVLTEEDGNYGKVWEEKKCSHSACDYFHTTEPNCDESYEDR